MEDNSRRAGAGNGHNQGNNRNRDNRGGYRGKGGRSSDRRSSGGKRSGGYNGHGRRDDRRGGRNGGQSDDRRHDGERREGYRGSRNGDSRGGYRGKRDDDRRGGYRGNGHRSDDRRRDDRGRGGAGGHDRHERHTDDHRDRRRDDRRDNRYNGQRGRDDRRNGGDRGRGSSHDSFHKNDRFDNRSNDRRREHASSYDRDNRRKDDRRDSRQGGYGRDEKRGYGRGNRAKAPRHGDMGGGQRERNQRKFDREEPKPFGYDRRKHRDVDAERAEVFGTRPVADRSADKAVPAPSTQVSDAEQTPTVSVEPSAAQPVIDAGASTAAAAAPTESAAPAASEPVAASAAPFAPVASAASDGASAAPVTPESGDVDATADGAAPQGSAPVEGGDRAPREDHNPEDRDSRTDHRGSGRGFDRRRDDRGEGEPFYPEFYASCQGGLEEICAKELKSFGIRKVRPLAGGVTFYAEKEKAYKALLWSRTASRILAVLDRVGCRDAEELYRNVRQMPWHRIIAPGSKIAVFSTGGNDDLRNSKFTNQKVKDAICDKIRQVTGERPDVDRKNPDATISVRVNRDRATISFDLTGNSLYQRSYIARHGQNVAVDVALANALLAVVNWRTLGYRRHYRLVDPVCNNPMLIVEAACEAADRAPGLTRASWGFTGWAEHDDALWNALLDEADERFENGLNDISRLGALALGISRRPIVADQAAVILKAAGVEGVGQVISVGEDAVGAAVDRSMHAARRAAESAIKRAEAQNDTGKPIRQASVVAANLLPEHDADGLSVAKNAELFIRAAEQAPDGSTFGQVGAELRAVYGHSPVEEHVVGGKRVDAPLQIFNKKPAARTPITVVGLEDGIEHHVPVYEEGTQQFAARLRKTAKERRKWAQALGITCYRIYDADLLDYMVAIDRYEDLEGEVYLTIAEYEAPASVDQDRARRRFEDVVAITPIVLGMDPAHIFVKTRRQAQGGSQYRDAGTASKVILVKEGGYTFEVDLGGRLDTGLFLDHRITRHLIEKRAQGKRFLNLFAYTGSASVYAAGGGARSTVTVDMSRHYLAWAERNMERNGFEGKAHHYEHGDVMSWLSEARRKHRHFDLVFVDPPTFSNSKQMGSATWDVQRDHFELLVGVSHLLDPQGVAVFSCNLRGFKPDIWRLTHFGIALEDITEQTIPQDFERRGNIHKCYLVRRMTPEEREQAVAEIEAQRDAERAQRDAERADRRREDADGAADADASSVETDGAAGAETDADIAAPAERVSLEVGTAPSEAVDELAEAVRADVSEREDEAEATDVEAGPQRISIQVGTVPAVVPDEAAAAEAAQDAAEQDEPSASHPGTTRISMEVGTVPGLAAELDLRDAEAQAPDVPGTAEAPQE